MKRRRKPPEQTARQLLNWVARTVPRFALNTGDEPMTVTVCASYGQGFATSASRSTPDVVAAIARARAMWVRQRATERADHRRGGWPHNHPSCCEWSRTG